MCFNKKKFPVLIFLATGHWFLPGTPVSLMNKTDCHDIAEIFKITFSDFTKTVSHFTGISKCLELNLLHCGKFMKQRRIL